MTECNPEQLEFHALRRRAVVGKFDGGMISSDGGGLLLAEAEAKTKIVKRLAQQFVDHRDPDAIEHRSTIRIAACSTPAQLFASCSRPMASRAA